MFIPSFSLSVNQPNLHLFIADHTPVTRQAWKLEIWGVWHVAALPTAERTGKRCRRWGEEEGGEGGEEKEEVKKEGTGVEKKRRMRGGEEKREGENGKGRAGAGQGQGEEE